MMTAEPAVTVRLEAGHRLVAHCPWHDEVPVRAEALLRRTGRLPGTARLAQVNGVTVVLADTYLCEEDHAYVLAERRLQRQLAGMQAAGPPLDVEFVATLLAENAAVTEPTDGAWTVRSLRGEPVDLTVRSIAGGLRVEALLSEAPPGGDAQVVAALSEFLLAAQTTLRFARIELSERGFLIVSACDQERADEHFGRSLAAVVRGVKRLGAEATALSDPQFASEYLEHMGHQQPYRGH